ncbi:MAG: hypothetical protein ABI726_07150 [bacterium]
MAALALAGPASAGGSAPVKDGRYAGGGKRLFVFFDVSNRTIPFARIDSEKLSTCAVDGPAVFDSDTVDAHGRFVLKDSSTFPNETIKVSGRFVTSTRVRGKIKWTTASNCPAGTYGFDYRADRYGPLE